MNKPKSHGDRRMYESGCRCTPCVATQRARWAEYRTRNQAVLAAGNRARRRAKVEVNPNHYREDYARYRESKIVASAIASKREISASRAWATRNGQHWTGPEIETAMRPDLSVRECSMLIGRTVAAVWTMRGLCKKDPRYADFGYWAS